MQSILEWTRDPQPLAMLIPLGPSAYSFSSRSPHTRGFVSINRTELTREYLRARVYVYTSRRAQCDVCAISDARDACGAVRARNASAAHLSFSPLWAEFFYKCCMYVRTTSRSGARARESRASSSLASLFAILLSSRYSRNFEFQCPRARKGERGRHFI